MSDVVASVPNSTPAAAPSTPANTSSTTPAPGVNATNATPQKASGSSPTPNAQKVSTPQGASSVSADAPDQAETSAQAEERKEAAKRKYKLMVDKQEQELELSDEEISVRLQKGLAAEKRMQEAAEVRKQYKQFMDEVKKDPFKLLSSEEFGVNLEELAEKHLAEKYRREAMSEEARAQLELKEKLEAYEAREKQEQERIANEKRAAYEEQVFKKTEEFFLQTLEKHNLPKDYETLAVMSEIGLMNLEHGIEMTADQMAAEVKAKFARFGGGYKKLRGEALLAELGDDLVKDILQTANTRLKAKSPFDPKPPAQNPGDLEDKPKRPVLSPRDFRNKLKLNG